MIEEEGEEEASLTKGSSASISSSLEEMTALLLYISIAAAMSKLEDKKQTDGEEEDSKERGTKKTPLFDQLRRE